MARQLLGAAAVIGRSFDFDTVRAASGRSDEEAIDGAGGAGRRAARARVPGPAAYDFSHEKLRELVYEETGRRAGGCCTGAWPRRCCAPGAARRAVAEHLAWPAIDAGAAEQYRIAGRARRVAARPRRRRSGTSRRRWRSAPDPRLHERIGDLRTLIGDYGGALASYETAAADGERAALARIEHKLGGVHQRRGEWERAEAPLRGALEAGAGDTGLRARVLADLSLTLHHAGDRAGGRARAGARARRGGRRRPRPGAGPQPARDPCREDGRRRAARRARAQPGARPAISRPVARPLR